MEHFDLIESRMMEDQQHRVYSIVEACGKEYDVQCRVLSGMFVSLIELCDESYFFRQIESVTRSRAKI